MRLPIDKVAKVFRAGATAKKESDIPVKVCVYLDTTASPFLVDAVRGAFVPQTTSGILRVERIGDEKIHPKQDNDVVLVLSCGSPRLESAVQEIVIGGAPVVVIAESSVEAPFIQGDTPMLGLVAAGDKVLLLETLARWILDRTEKGTAFAANFPFMRIAAANRAITSCAIANMATGALVFIPGADLPVMLAAQVGMLVELAGIFGKPIKAERGSEVAGLIGASFLLRTLSRAVVRETPHVAFLTKALIAGAGTYAMGKGLVALYENDVDYSRANEFVAAAATQARRAAETVSKHASTEVPVAVGFETAA